ncbi:MAG: glycosyltransferase [Bacteroidales bacterium]|nr:glycosyltransferase [Bacteroidales bacterium]
MSNSKSPKVSVVIPVYNTGEYIGSVLDDICGQTIKDIEILVVNDGSTDDSQEIIDRYKAEHPEIISLHEENKGQGAARNLALRHATGEFIYFMDSDDRIDKDALERLYDKAVENNLDLVLFDADTINDSDGPKFIYDRSGIVDTKRKWTGPELMEYELRHDCFYVSPCLMLVKKNIIDAFTDFPEGTIHEDNVLAVHVMLTSKNVMYMKEKFFHRRVRKNSTMTTTYGMRNINGYLAACKIILSWKNGVNDNLIDLYMKCTLDSVIWLASGMPWKDKLRTYKKFRNAGINEYVSRFHWIRLVLKTK